MAASGRRGLSEQVAASGRKWSQEAASGRWLQGVSRASAGQPLAATRVVASGRKWPHVAASGGKRPQVAGVSRASAWRPLAATCSHLQPLEWPQVAASGRSRKFQSKWPQVAASGRSRQFQASGRKWPLSAKPISTLKATSLCFIFLNACYVLICDVLVRS